MMSRVKKGLVAGLVATLATSLLEVPNMFLNWFDPFPNIIARTLGLESMAMGWALHLAAGALILGPLFGYLYPRLPTDTPETKGIVFAVGAFIIMLLGVFMLGNHNTFTGSSGFGTVAWLLITHAVFGIILGNVYGRLVEREKRAAHAVHGHPA